MTVEEWLGKDNILGIDIWKKKYQRNDEAFDEWLDRVSGGDSSVREIIANKEFLFGGRILSNRGVDSKEEKTTYSNCYVLSVNDSIESIYETCKRLARTYSFGGGCGLDLSKLAPSGARVRNQAKNTSGAVSFMDTFSQVTEQIGQNGRRGALMLSMDCKHPDIKKFITVKSDLNKVNYANISVRVSNDFMDAVKNDGDWTLTFTRPETKETTEETVKARELFDLICEQNWDYAEPGVLYWDTICNYNLLNNNPDFEYAGVNPCVSGDTLLLTKNGYLPINSLCDKKVQIWNGFEFSEVTPHVTGHNQPMLKISFSDGSEIKCTHYHKFILKDEKRIEAKNIHIGDKLIKCEFPVISNDSAIELEEKDAYTRGFFLGDGSSESSRNRKSIKLYGKKRELIDYLEYKNSTYCQSFDGEFLTLRSDDVYNKDFVPDTSYSVQSRLNWLAGYIDSDGTIQSSDGSISISSINKDVLYRVKLMLNTLGCNASVRLMHDEVDRELPTNNGTDETAIYHCKSTYRLLISASNVQKLINIGLNTHRVCPSPNVNRAASRFITVESIEHIEECDVVYCFDEPKNHSGIFNGIITAQCSEEPLPDSGACLLGSINLSAFVNNGDFDLNRFVEVVDISIKALNDVLDEGVEKHPLKSQRQCASDWRQIGLGFMGLADCLIKMGIKYGSDEAVNFCDVLGKNFAAEAIVQSARLAKIDGAYPKYNNLVMDSNFFYRHRDYIDDKEIKFIQKWGLRNSQLLTVAPTGTLSTMLGISGGIEPIFANSYTRMTKSLHGEDHEYKVYTPIVREYMEEHGITDEADLPDYFVTSATIPVKDRINMQAVWQKHIDASISSTVNLPNEATVDDVKEIYMSAWEKGLKGITVFRAGCARTSILTSSEEKEREHKTSKMSDTSNLDVIGLEHHLTTGCGSLHICAYFDKQGNLKNTYLSKGSSGGCNNFMISLSRMISLAARNGVPLKDIVDQLHSCGTCPSYAVRRATKKDVSPGSCCPVAIGNALIEMSHRFRNDVSIPKVDTGNMDVCPECGGVLKHEMGCVTCINCGYSKCN